MLQPPAYTADSRKNRLWPDIALLPALLATSVLAQENEQLCRKDQAVNVLYAGSWYPGRVLDGPDQHGNCLVAYDGYGSNWNEWVTAARLRQPEAPAVAMTEVPLGIYNCYTFDDGQLNYSHTDIQILAYGRYRIGDSRGWYQLADGGLLSFSGSANASGRISLKHGGIAQIDLVFNDDARASMVCSQRSGK